MKADPHPQEQARLAALRRYEILDTPREADFDDLVLLASQICETPVSVVNLVDATRQWFKAEVGLGVRETPLETSICAHVILGNDFVEIPDTLADPRLTDNPLCQGEAGLRFYAGALLTSANGLPIGALCVLDRRPRTLTQFQRDALRTLARQVMTQLNLRAALANEQVLRNEIDHRVKNSLQAVSAFVSLERSTVESEDSKRLLDQVGRQIETVALLHDHLGHFTSGSIELPVYLGEVASLIDRSTPSLVRVSGRFDEARLGAREAAILGTVINELVANATKHSFGPEGGHVELKGERLSGLRYRLTCSDNGQSDGTAVPWVEVTNGGPKTPSGGSRRGGLGMRIIAASVRQLGGTLAANKGPDGYSTTIEIETLA